MSFKVVCVVSSVAMLMQFANVVAAQEKESQWIGLKPVAKKVVIEPKAVPKKETRGEVKFTEYELVWPSIETHDRSFVTVTGEKVRWTQEFVDGDAPVFNAIEEKIDAGNYTYRVEYISNEAGKAKKEREAASAKRRELLKKRLDLLNKGDREGSKAALEEANAIRISQPGAMDLNQFMNRGNSDNISRTGRFLVKQDGKVAVHASSSERENERSAEEVENKEY